MEGSRSRNDAAVYTGPGVPRIFEDAYVVNSDGTLKILRWSTRHEPKRHPIAEYAPGCWEHYEHQGEQGDEVAEQPKPAEAARAAPRKARASVRDVVEHHDGSRWWTPDDGPDPEPEMSPAEREAQIRSREPGVPENLQAAALRPALPPSDFAVPTHRLPQREPAQASDKTQLLPVVQDDSRQSPAPARRRGRTRGSWPRSGTGSLALAVVAALSVLASVH
jgi:hypothetical protein